MHLSEYEVLCTLLKTKLLTSGLEFVSSFSTQQRTGCPCHYSGGQVQESGPAEHERKQISCSYNGHAHSERYYVKNLTSELGQLQSIVGDIYQNLVIQ